MFLITEIISLSFLTGIWNCTSSKRVYTFDVFTFRRRELIISSRTWSVDIHFSVRNVRSSNKSIIWCKCWLYNVSHKDFWMYPAWLTTLVFKFYCIVVNVAFGIVGHSSLYQNNPADLLNHTLVLMNSYNNIRCVLLTFQAGFYKRLSLVVTLYKGGNAKIIIIISIFGRGRNFWKCIELFIFSSSSS